MTARNSLIPGTTGAHRAPLQQNPIAELRVSRQKLAGYAGCNENFVLLTTGITGVLSFEL